MNCSRYVIVYFGHMKEKGMCVECTMYGSGESC